MVSRTTISEILDLGSLANMLRAIAASKDELHKASPEALRDLDQSLSVCDAALRRVAAEMRPQRGED